MSNSTPETASRSASPPSAQVSGSEFRQLFVVLCCALVFDALRLKPREKQLALLLGLGSFAKGFGFGAINMSAWRLRLSTWRSNELKNTLADWKRSGWLALDATEQTFRLALDRLPGWKDVQTIVDSEQTNGTLGLLTEDDLHKTFAKFSQQSAIFSQRGVGGNSETFPETFDRSNVQRSNVERSEESCEIFANQLKDRVRAFVTERDWCNKKLWDQGTGYRHSIFMQEGKDLDAALRYCQAGLKSGECHVKKTPGAMLWDEFQRMRRQRASSPTTKLSHGPANNQQI